MDALLGGVAKSREAKPLGSPPLSSPFEGSSQPFNHQQQQLLIGNDNTELDSDKEGEQTPTAAGTVENPFVVRSSVVGGPASPLEDSEPPLVGTEEDRPVPKYVKMRVLGHGAYGEAWLCRHQQTGNLAVVKMMNLPNMSRKEVAYAQSEIRCMASIHHTNIIKYFDSHSTGSMLSIAMEFADAGDLRRHTKQRKAAKQHLSESEAMFLFVQVAIAIQHIHSCYMLHRDVKSANVLIMTNGLVKLADFGFSRQYEDTVSRPVATTFCGTPYYLAPEIWRNQRYSNKAEVWSLGVLLYELLALDRPFQSPSLSGLMEMITSGTYRPIPPQYSTRLRHFVATLLDTDVTQRPTSLEIFQIPYVREHLDLLRRLVKENEHIPHEQRIQWLAETDVLITKCAGFPPFPLRAEDPATDEPLAPTSPPDAPTTPPAAGGSSAAPATSEKRPSRAGGSLVEVKRDVTFAGPVLKLSAVPRVKWAPKYLQLVDGQLHLSEPNDFSNRRTIAIDHLKSVAPIALQAAQLPFVFAIHTKDAKCTWMQATSEEDRQIWLQKIQQAMGVF